MKKRSEIEEDIDSFISSYDSDIEKKKEAIRLEAIKRLGDILLDQKVG